MRDVDVMQGTLDLILLKALSWGTMHGYGLSRWVRQATDGDLQLEEGALYPALHRLERRGWIGSEWGVSDNNRRAKFYRLTAAGRRQLRAETAAWQRYAALVERMLAAAAPEVA
jgi:PadR family transcriptional regulator, regulatory protein PadR